MSFDNRALEGWSRRLTETAGRIAADYPGDGPHRQPVHTVYGGAHIFNWNTAPKLGELAVEAMRAWIPDPETLAEVTGISLDLAGLVHPLVAEKLKTEAVEDFRIDFEDGYGHRPDPEEDGHARSAALEVARGMEEGTLPPFIGIRIKPLSGELHRRALSTLNLFLTTLVAEGGGLPEEFVVTLPKVQSPAQVEVLDEALGMLEKGLGVGPLPIELMVETPQTVIARDGGAGVRSYVDAGGGRVRAAHFGTYDYTASLNITAAHQTMDHPGCDFARHVLQVSLAGTGIWLSDGATNVMPVPIHRGDDLTEAEVEANRQTIHQAMALHYSHVRRSLLHGYYQGWDLHPGQLPTRYAAVYSFFFEGLDQACQRLSAFIESAAKATLVGEVFDDAATGQGLLNFFLRAINCGAITEDEATTRTGVTPDELRTRSFLAILEGRRG